MITERKNYREAQLQIQLKELKLENARLKDCILLQQKIIETEKKQKKLYESSYRTNISQDLLIFNQKLKSRRSLAGEGAKKLLQSLSERTQTEQDRNRTQKDQKLKSTNNDSRKTTDDTADDSMKMGKSKKKLLTLKDLKSLDDSTSCCSLLYHPAVSTVHIRRKSYLDKLLQKEEDQ